LVTCRCFRPASVSVSPLTPHSRKRGPSFLLLIIVCLGNGGRVSLAVLLQSNTALPSAIKATCWLKGSSLCTLIKKCQLPPGIQSDRRHLMPTHRARCPNTLVNQSRRVSERIACMGSFSLTAKNAKAPCCASICGIKTDAHFANAPVWPSAPVRPSPLFSRETGVGFILFHAKYLLLPQSWPRKQQHTAGASLCAFVSWAVASYDTVTGRKLI